MSKPKRLKIYLITAEGIITQTLQEFLTALEYDVVLLNSIHELPEIIEKESEGKGSVIVEGNIFMGEAKTIIRKIHKQYPTIFFIVITANTPVLSAKEAILYGIYGYLHKPISLAELELLLVRLGENRIEVFN